VSFRFSRDEVENNKVDTNEQFGFRLRNGVLQMIVGAGGWQALTDDTTMVVTAFRVSPEIQDLPLEGLCEQPCPASIPDCGPHQFVRRLTVSITGRATTDSNVVRSIRSTVRLRNDAVIGRCPT
jgi:type IV pilus assembly protein PilW